jgi:hypothetical protein
MLTDAQKKNNFLKKHNLKRFNSAVRLLKVVKKVKWVYLKTANQGLFVSVILLWVTTIPRKLGNHLKLGMGLILQKAQQVLRTGQTKFYGQVSRVRRSLLQKANVLLKEPEVKLSGKDNTILEK